MKIGMICELGLLSQYKGYGYGEQLSRYAIENLRFQGADSVRVITTAESVGVNFYQDKLGFQYDGLVRTIRGTDDAFYWRLNFKPSYKDLFKQSVRRFFRR